MEVTFVAEQLDDVQIGFILNPILAHVDVNMLRPNPKGDRMPLGAYDLLYLSELLDIDLL